MIKNAKMCSIISKRATLLPGGLCTHVKTIGLTKDSQSELKQIQYQYQYQGLVL